MKCLKRNQKRLEYLPYAGAGSDIDENGDHTGDYSDSKILYGTPIPFRGNISSPSGQTNQTFYGKNISYTHVLVINKPVFDLNEYGLIRWNGKLYDIKAVYPSMNSVSVALKQQTANLASLIPQEEEEETEGPEGETS